MNEYEGHGHDRDLALALRRLDDALVIPEADPDRLRVLMAAFDAAHAPAAAAASSGRQYWFMAALATAAVVLMAGGLTPALTGRHGSPPGAERLPHKPSVPTSRDVQPGPQPPNEFVMVPGAAGLPRMESGSLVRMDVPVAMLISLGVTPPPANRTTTVRADLVIAQDGLPRAIRLVN